jgi:hypothetical protein
MKPVFRAIALSLIALVSACSYDLEHDGAFDPNSPAEKQAKSIVLGAVTLEGEADSSGVDVQLQNDSRTYAVATDESGAYKITGVVPGKYLLKISTRYFEGITTSVDVPLGKRLTMGAETLPPKRSTVKGTAIAKRMYNRQFVEEGGVVVSLTKEASIRGGSVTAATSPGAFAAAGSINMPQNSTISDNDGSFSLSGVPAGIYLIVASSPGISTLPVGKVTVTGEGDVILEKITLEAVTGFFDILGTADWQPSSVYTNTPDVTLKLSGFNADTMKIGSSPSGDPEDCALGMPEPFVGQAVHTVPKEGRNTICVQFVSADGRESAVLTGSIVRDTLAPDAASVGLVINAGGAYASDNRVAVGLSAFDGNTGVDRMLVAERADFAGAVTQPFAPRLVYGFPVTDGVRTLWAKFGDRAGNYSTAVSAFVVVDKAAPVLVRYAVLNGYGEVVSAANPSRTSQVVLHLDMADANPMEVLVSDRVDFAGASWIPYRSDIIWNFIPPTAPEGAVQTLYVKVRDAAGHVVDIAPYQVAVDTIAPQNVAVDVRGNGIVSQDQYTTTGAVTVNFTFPAIDTSFIELSTDGSFSNRVRFTARPSTTYTLPALDGVKPVYVRFIDRAGNLSATVVDQIVLDTTPPQLASVTLPDGEYTNLQQVRLNTTAADAYQMQVTEGTSCGGAWNAYATTVIHDFVTSTEEWKKVSVRFRDGAGNASACITQKVLFDRTPPSSTPFEAVDSAYNPISLSNVLRYFIHLKVTDASPVTVQYNEIQYWSNVAREAVDRGVDIYRPWDVKAPANVTGETRHTYVRLEDQAGNFQVIGPIDVNVVLLSASMQMVSAVKNPTLSIIIGTSNATRLWISENPDYSGYTEYGLLPTTTTVTYTLSPGDGSKTLYGRFFTSDGSFADTNANTRLDTTNPYVALPTNLNVNIDADAAYTSAVDGGVMLTLRAEDATTAIKDMQVVNVASSGACVAAAFSAASWVAYSSYINWTLDTPGAGVEGNRYICARFRDTVGNLSTPVYDAIWYDTKAPVAGATPMLIDGGKTYTTNASSLVSLLLSATGANWMRFENDGQGYSGWVQYSSLQAWTIPLSDGAHTVSVQFADSAYNIVGPYSQSIIRDTVKPLLPSLLINAGQAVTNSTAATLTLGAVGADYMTVSNSPTFSGAVSTAVAGSYAWSLPNSQGMNTVYAKFRDLAGNESDVASAAIRFDSVAPTGVAVTINGGAAAVSDATGTVALGLAASDTNSGLGNMIVANVTGANKTCAAALAGVAPQPYSAAIAGWTLDNAGPNLEGRRWVCYMVGDNAFKWSAPVSDAIDFDTKAPVVAGAGLAIASVAGVTNSTSTKLTFTQTGASQVQIANDGGAYSNWLTIASPMNWTLASGDGTHSVSVRFRDVAGNVAGPYTASVDLDTTPPTGTWLQVEFAPAVTRSATVNLVLNGGAEAVAMDVSNYANFSSLTHYATYTASVANWPLLTGTQGTKVIYARFIDSVGNMSTPVSTSIVYDTVPPALGTVSINGGQAVTAGTAVTVDLTSPDAAWMNVSQSACGAGSWTAYAASLADTLAGSDGTKSVYVKYRDAAGNETATCESDSIGLDRALATPGFAVAFTDATIYAGRTRSSLVRLYVYNAAGDVSQIAVSSDPTFAGAAWQTPPVTGYLDIPLVDGANTWYVIARDAAFNTSVLPGWSATVTRDTAAPAAGTVEIVGSTGYTNLATVDLTFTYDFDAVVMDVSNTGTFTVGTYTRYAAAPGLSGWALSSGQGAKVVYVRFLDLAHNESPGTWTSIVYDSIVPAVSSITVNGGQAVTNVTAITAAFTTTDAPTEMYASAVTCAAPVWEAPFAAKNFTLPAADGTYWVYATARDNALNTAPCAKQSITLDRSVYAPGFAVSITGPGVYGNATAALTANVQIAGLTTDVTQMAVSTNPAFAGAVWQTKASSLAVSLVPDVTNTFYVRLRDAAGNTTSPDLSASITVDHTAAAPVLQVADITGDGKAVSMSVAELRWDGVAAASDITRFAVEYNSGAGWVALTTVNCSGTCDTLGEQSYAAAVTTAGALTYQFRVRAHDYLGNDSAWSNIVQTTPREPVRTIRWVRTTSETRYRFAPAAVTYAYDGDGPFALGTMSQLSRTHYDIPRWNETVLTSIYDALGTFAWGSTFTLGKATRGTADALAASRAWPAVDVDAFGRVHMVYRRVGTGLIYRTNRSGAWQEYTVATGNLGDYAAVKVDSGAGVHVAYFDRDLLALRYARWNGAGFTVETAVAGVGGVRYNGAWLGMDVGPDGLVNVSYLSQATASVQVAYVRGSAGAWNTPTVIDDLGTPPDGKALTTALRVTDGSVKLVYYAPAQGDVRFVEKAAGSSSFSSPVTIAGATSANDLGQYSSIDVAHDGKVHVAYVDTTASALGYVTRSGAAWSAASAIDAPAAVTGEVTLRVDARDHVRVAFGAANGVVLNRFEQGAWASTVVDATAGTGVFSGLALDRGGNAHLVYSGDAVGGTINYAYVDTYGWQTYGLPGASGAASSQLGLDGNGHRHVVYRTGSNTYYANDVDGVWRSWLLSNDTKYNPHLSVEGSSYVHLTYVPGGTTNGIKYRQFTIATSTLGSEESPTNSGVNAWGGVVTRTSGYKLVVYQKTNNDIKQSYYTPSSWNDDNNLSGSTVAGAYASVAVQPGTNNTFVAYYGSSSLKLSRYTTSWQSVYTIESGGTGDTGKYPSLAYDNATGKLHVAYVDVANRALRYATNPGAVDAAWSLATVDTLASGEFRDPSLVVDANGKIHVTYYSSLDGLRYATNASGAWVVDTLDPNQPAPSTRYRGLSNSLGIDAAGKLHAAYLDSVDGATGDVVFDYDFAGLLRASSIVQTK